MAAERDKTPVAVAAECRAIIVVNRSEGRGSEDLGETQAVEGYGCVCSFKSDIKKEFTNHLVLAGRPTFIALSQIIYPWYLVANLHYGALQ